MIPPDTIARVKERTDIVALIGESVRLMRRGRSFVGLCPFHKEKSPSFHVHAERGFFHCFGCQERGSAVDFVMKTHGLEFVEAIEYLADRAGIAIEKTASNAQLEKAKAQRSERDELMAVNQLAAAYWERMLGVTQEGMRTPHPLAGYAERELHKRGMPPAGTSSDEAERWARTLAAFRVGYAPPGWDGLANHLRKQGISPALGERAGLLVAGPRGHYDRFRHRLMFAVMDPLGRIIAWSGRALATPAHDELTRAEPSAPSYDGEAPAKYINSPESPIYRKGEQLFGLFQAKQAMRQRQEAVLVEGNFDVVSLHASGIEHAVAPLGTAFTADQAKLLKRFAPTVVVLFDGDAAGKKATRAARVPCREGGLEARVATLPEGKDPDDYVRSHGAAALLDRIKGARGMLEHMIQEALEGERFEGASLNERVKRVEAVAKLLKEESDPTLQLMAKKFADQLSRKLIVNNAPADDLSELERLVTGALRSDAHAPPRQTDAQRRDDVNDGAYNPEKRFAYAIFGALLDFPDLLQDPDVRNALSLLEGDVALAVVATRKQWLDRRRSGGPSASSGPSEISLDVADFLATLPLPIQRFAAGRLASPIFETPAEAKANLLENAAHLERSLERRQRSAKVSLLERSTSSYDADGEAALREIAQAARKRRGLD